jgi:hypothetical protein
MSVRFRKRSARSRSLTATSLVGKFPLPFQFNPSRLLFHHRKNNSPPALDHLNGVADSGCMISATNVRSAGDLMLPKPVRSWQEISEEASHTTDPKRLQELALELVRV